VTGAKYYIVMSGAEHLDFFENNAAYQDETWWWTVPPTAREGEEMFAYLTAPVSRIVGRMKITGEPFHNTGNIFPNPKCNGKWMAPVGDVINYPARPELSIAGLRKLFGADWGWVRYPRGRTTIPAHIIQPFMQLIRKVERRR
jgi:hypothetical protein